MPTDIINMQTALLQLVQSWERAGLQDLMRPREQAVRDMLQTLQVMGVAEAESLALVQSHKSADKAVSPRIKDDPAVPPPAIKKPAAPPASGPGRAITGVPAPQSNPAMMPLPASPVMAKPTFPPANNLGKLEIPPLKPPFTAISAENMSTQPTLKNNPITEVVPAAERPMRLEVIAREVAGCPRCAELASTRTQTVFHDGSCTAELCLVGEAPGADEDETGVPFVGRAGQLLTKIIEACQLTREQVYICNVLKCRPPGNRPPEAVEVANCRGYLERQLEIVHPRVIVCLGTTAAQCLLNSQISIGKLRKKWHDYRGIPLYCTYHPSYLLRNPAAKKDVWEDMKVVMARLGVEL
ncbi:MAG: uracil-DNA glycosylase family protein [Pirellulales bacterium]|nr:uracil-DNA glycosylase family protein [Pirellulales bacterium]